MEEELRQLVENCISSRDGNPLWPDSHTNFCAAHGLTTERFYYLYARYVAEEFARGEMSYADGDAAMNRLFGVASLDLTDFAWDIFQAFDAGEFFREEDPKGTIPWQIYTLPDVMEALAKIGWLPRP